MSLLTGFAPPARQAVVRAALETRAPRRHDRELLSAFGIDLDEVRRRMLDATPARLDDPRDGGSTGPASARSASP